MPSQVTGVVALGLAVGAEEMEALNDDADDEGREADDAFFFLATKN